MTRPRSVSGDAKVYYLKSPVFNKNYEIGKKQGSVTHTGKKAGNINCLSENPDGGLSEVFKATVIKMFKKTKGNHV